MRNITIFQIKALQCIFIQRIVNFLSVILLIHSNHSIIKHPGHKGRSRTSLVIRLLLFLQAGQPSAGSC